MGKYGIKIQWFFHQPLHLVWFSRSGCIGFPDNCTGKVSRVTSFHAKVHNFGIQKSCLVEKGIDYSTVTQTFTVFDKN